MKNKIAIVMLAVLLIGCASKEDEAFGHSPRIMTDDSGKRYVVQYHAGGTYTVQLVEGK